MSDLGPTYPFEPLPPPENPSVRAKHLSALKNGKPIETGRIEKAESKRPREIAFRSLLEKKAEESQNQNTILSEEENKKVQDVAKDLEAFFIYMILKSFNKTLIDGGLFPKEAGASLYMDMFFEGVANETSKSPNGFGLAEEIVKSIRMSMGMTNGDTSGLIREVND